MRTLLPVFLKLTALRHYGITASPFYMSVVSGVPKKISFREYRADSFILNPPLTNRRDHYSLVLDLLGAIREN